MKKVIAIIILLFALPASYGQNLIINPSAESDPFGGGGGWTSVVTGSSCFTGSNWRITGNQNGFPTAQSGSQLFYSGCGSVSGEIYQDIDISANATLIDAGSQIFDFSGYTQSYTQTPADGAQIIVEYRNATSTVLSSFNTGVTQNQGTWVQYTDSRTAPVGARSIRIRLLSIANSGTSVDGYFDNLSLTTNIGLPIVLLTFRAETPSNSKVKLIWQTATEINNDYFTIERSKNGINWESVKIIGGAGNSSHIINYSSSDDNPFPGVSYYRLKQTDFDGRAETFPEVRVKIEKIIDSQVEIYPNPTQHEISVEGNRIDIEQISICNDFGQNVTTQVKLIKKNKTQLIVDLSALKSGVYYIKTKTTVNKLYKL